MVEQLITITLMKLFCFCLVFVSLFALVWVVDRKALHQKSTFHLELIAYCLLHVFFICCVVLSVSIAFYVNPLTYILSPIPSFSLPPTEWGMAVGLPCRGACQHGCCFVFTLAWHSWKWFSPQVFPLQTSTWNWVACWMTADTSHLEGPAVARKQRKQSERRKVGKDSSILTLMRKMKLMQAYLLQSAL